jgi:hypothetical protein
MPRQAKPARSAAWQRFLDSMVMDFEKWHDGIGYDLAALDEMTGEERREIESMLIGKAGKEWRDFEALKRLGTSSAREEIRRGAAAAEPGTRASAARHLDPDDPDRARALARSLSEARPFDGLAPLLDQAAAFHPPEVVAALLRGAATADDPTVAVNYAAMLYYIHGLAEEPFDWGHRPFFLRFGEGGTERATAFEELCRAIGIDPGPHRNGLPNGA